MIFSKKFHLLLFAFLVATQVPIRCANDDNNNFLDGLAPWIGALAILIGIGLIFEPSSSTPPQKSPDKKDSISPQEQRDIAKATAASLADVKKQQQKNPPEPRLDQRAKDEQVALYNSLQQNAKKPAAQQQDRHERAYPAVGSAQSGTYERPPAYNPHYVDPKDQPAG